MASAPSPGATVNVQASQQEACDREGAPPRVTPPWQSSVAADVAATRASE